MNTEHPQVFISYAWLNETIRERTMELAERLRYDGVDVVLDLWKLKSGHDKYAFMERCVTDKNITHVLIICDKAYKERADNRQGGVGDETVVITPEVYGNIEQEKFIPLIFECDENGNPFVPAYLKSRKYIDFSNEDNYENAYEELLRTIYEMPLNREPKLGNKPDWLNNEDVNYNELTLLTKSLKSGSVEKLFKYQSICTKFSDALVDILNDVRFVDDKFDADDLVKKISKLKPIRDAYFDYGIRIRQTGETGVFLKLYWKVNFFSTDFITKLFEKLYNEVGIIDKDVFNESTFEYYDFFRWESFIGTIAILRHYERYSEIYSILNHTYFLRESWFIHAKTYPCTFIKFRQYFKILQEIYQKKYNLHYVSFAAQLLTEREKRPILSQQALAETDLLLYQLSTVLISVENNPVKYVQKWFPCMYPYVKRTDLWIQLQSKKFCLKILPLFGVKTIDDLKESISRATYDSDIHIRGTFNGAPNILSYISLEKIATLP